MATSAPGLRTEDALTCTAAPAEPQTSAVSGGACLASCSQVAAGGDHWLLMAIRGHLGGTFVMRRRGMPAAPVLRLSACVCRCRLPVHQHLWLPRCETLAVDDHQRRVWAAMLDQVREYRAGRV